MIQVRTAERRDAASLELLIREFRDSLGVHEPTEAALQALLPELQDDPSIEFAIAVAPGGEAVGYTQMRFMKSLWAGGVEAILDDLFVRSHLRNAGIGSALIENTLVLARSRGAKFVNLHTNEKNDRAQRLYGRAGFRLQSDELWSGGREIGYSRPI